MRPLADEQLDIFTEAAATLGMDGQDVLLDGQIDRRRVDAGQVELDHERLALPEGIDGHGGGTGGGAEDLLREAVEVTERIGAHEHETSSSRGRAGIQRCEHDHQPITQSGGNCQSKLEVWTSVRRRRSHSASCTAWPS